MSRPRTSVALTPDKLRVEETDFAELADGSLAEVVEDPENPSETTLAMYRDGEVRYTRWFQVGERLLVPRVRHLMNLNAHS